MDGLPYCPKCGRQFSHFDYTEIYDQDPQGNDSYCLEWLCPTCDLTLVGAFLEVQYGRDSKKWPRLTFAHL